MIGNFSLDQLRVLVTIADTGSFSAAGRRLGRVQSAISQAIATLEAARGIALFDRSSHRPRLTNVGRVLVDQARLVLASAARFEAVAAGTRGGLEPELVLAIDPRSQLRKVPRATVPFLPREPLGVTWRDTTVYAVAPESQAARHGIAPGWKAYVRRTRNEERCLFIRIVVERCLSIRMANGGGSSSRVHVSRF